MEYMQLSGCGGGGDDDDGMESNGSPLLKRGRIIASVEYLREQLGLLFVWGIYEAVGS